MSARKRRSRRAANRRRRERNRQRGRETFEASFVQTFDPADGRQVASYATSSPAPHPMNAEAVLDASDRIREAFDRARKALLWGPTRSQTRGPSPLVGTLRSSIGDRIRSYPAGSSIGLAEAENVRNHAADLFRLGVVPANPAELKPPPAWRFVEPAWSQVMQSNELCSPGCQALQQAGFRYAARSLAAVPIALDEIRPEELGPAGDLLEELLATLPDGSPEEADVEEQIPWLRELAGGLVVRYLTPSEIRRVRLSAIERKHRERREADAQAFEEACDQVEAAGGTFVDRDAVRRIGLDLGRATPLCETCYSERRGELERLRRSGALSDAAFARGLQAIAGQRCRCEDPPTPTIRAVEVSVLGDAGEVVSPGRAGEDPDDVVAPGDLIR